MQQPVIKQVLIVLNTDGLERPWRFCGKDQRANYLREYIYCPLVWKAGVQSLCVKCRGSVYQLGGCEHFDFR